jgi:hypothetical protein
VISGNEGIDIQFPERTREVKKMVKKDLEIMLADSVTLSDDVKATVVSTIRPIPDGKPIIRYFSSSSSPGDIVEGTLQDIQNAGYKLEPKKVRLLVKSVEDVKDLGVGFKIGCNLSLEGGAVGSFEKSPGKQTEKHTETEFEIWYEVKKED